MDYAGFGRRHAYPVNRPLTDVERATHYDQKKAGNAPPMDFLSVIKLNSSYIELVDRWYPVRGFWAWTSAIIGFFVLCMILYLFYFLFLRAGTAPKEWWSPYVGGMLLSLMLVFVWFGVSYPFKLEFLRWTHYPMRLNRKTRQVHVFRQNGTVLTVPWDALYIVRGEAKISLVGTTYDLRAHVLDADGVTVRESFSLGYTMPCKPESMDKFWAFLQPYMEAPDGVERSYKHLQGGPLMPLDGRKEGWRWSIVRTFAPGWPYPWTMLLFCIPLGLNAVGRMFAMATSKQPRWQAEVEAANVIEADDPYQLTWRDNAPLGWWELYWPLICTVLGVGSFVGIIVSMLSTLWK